VYQLPARSGGCRDEHRTKQVGSAKIGYPVVLTTTIFDENNRPGMSFSQEVIEISQAALDDALFDVPAGYTEVQDRQQMFSAAAMMSAAVKGENGSTASSSANAGNTGGEADTRASAPVTPKKSGVIRIGIPPTETLAAGERLNPVTLGEATRKAMIDPLTRAGVDAVPLSARSPQQAELEAKQKECDFILYVSISHKRGGGGGLGGLLSKAAPIAEMMTAGGAESPGSKGEGAEGATPAAVSRSVKSKDELTLVYKTQAIGSVSTPPASLKTKAKSDGEDLLSPLAEQASAAVLTEVKKK
jgi:hypothetical protein